MRSRTQIELFGKVIIHPGSMILFIEGNNVFFGEVSSISVENGHEHYIIRCNCGKCYVKRVPIENVIEAFDIEDISNNDPLINSEPHYIH